MADNDEAVAVTGRPNDTPIRESEPAPLGGNSTFKDRAKARQKPGAKQVDDDTESTEDKSVTRASTKRKTK